MKRYCIVSFCNIYVLPYAKKYIDAIQQSNYECTLLYWDRDAINGENDNYSGCVKKIYQRKLDSNARTSDKILGYISARNYFISVLKQEQYDGVIFLQSHAAVACFSVLNKKYKNKYVIDIRDYTLENFCIYRNLETRVILNSFMTVISSPAYRNFLPASNYVMAHNYLPFPISNINDIRNRKISHSDPIRISFVGTVRFFDMDKKILTLFANDNRFCICYYGRGSDILEKYCIERNIRNANFYGSFSPEMTIDFYKNTDLINNLYGNNSPYLDFALSNKLYHTGQLYIPILTCPDTYMANITDKYQMGFTFDVNDSKSPDKLYRWYRNLDWNQLKKGCDSFLSDVRSAEDTYQQKIHEFLIK